MSSEIAVPGQRQAIGASIGLLLFVGSAGLVVWNLWYGTALAPALIALLILGAITRAWLSDGLGPALTFVLGAYVARHFVRCEGETISDGELVIGYRFLRRDWVYLRTELAAVESVEWSTGQASALAGKEMNDWHVTLWRHDDRGETRRKVLHCVNVGGTRDATESFGHALAALLRDHGVRLTLEESGTGYRRVEAP